MIRLLFSLIILLCHAAVTDAAPYVGSRSREYTQEQPLIYEDAWEKWPYAFINDKGEPDGFNVELVKKMMKRLDIPYEIHLRNQQTVHDDLRTDSADLSFGVAAEYNAPFGRFGNVTVCTFDNALLQLRKDSVGTLGVEDLRHRHFLVKDKSRAYYYLLEKGFSDSTLHVVSNMEAEVLRIVTEGKGEVLWNAMMLKWMMNKYHISNFSVTPVDIPSGEYRMMSCDMKLLHRLDSLCEVMKAEGEIDRMVHHWMYPEIQKEDTTALYVLIIFIVVGIVVIVSVTAMHNYRKYYSRNSLHDINSQMGLVLAANNMQVWVYNPLTRRYAWMTRDGKVDQEYSSFEFSRFYPGEDFNIIHTQVMEFLSQDQVPVVKKLRSYALGNPDRILNVEVHMEVLKDDYGKIYMVCGVQHDITDSKGALDRMRLLHQRHKTAFNIAVGGIMRFDGKGTMIDINQRVCERLGIKDREALLQRNYKFSDFGILSDIDIATCGDDIRFTSIVTIDEFEHSVPFIDVMNFHPVPVMYFYMHIIKSYDADGRLISIILYMRDITENTILQKMLTRKTRHAEVLKSERDIIKSRRDYSLRESDIWMLRYYPDTKKLMFYDRVDNRMKPFSQLQILEIVDRRDMKKVFRVFHKVDALDSSDVHLSVATLLRNANGEFQHFSIDAHPVYDNEGKVHSYFGICRDMTSQIQLQHQLMEETKKAREAEIVKQNFLKNMTYSIRQPLVTMRQSIESLAGDITEQMEQQMLNNITLNTQRLITLSDDTLLLSRIEAGLVEPKIQEMDFVKVYRQSIDEGLENLRTDAVLYNIVEPYEELLIKGDAEILSRILRETVRLSATYTRFGSLSVRYLYHRTNITIAIEDTGQGLPPEMYEKIFEPRIGVAYNHDAPTVNTSGLEMPICHAYIQMLKGSIDISSDPGRGTSIYINIPLNE